MRARLSLVAVLLGLPVLQQFTVAQEPVPYTNAEYRAAPEATGSWHNFWFMFDLHRRRVNVWPEPFVNQDRELVRDPFRIMADNGWKLQNTLSHYHFTEDSTQLNTAGQSKVQYILTQVPPHRRQIFVLADNSVEVTASRVGAVYRAMAEITPGSMRCPVMTTRIEPRGGDGSYLDYLDRSYRVSIPAPRLPSQGRSVVSESSSAGETTR